MLHNPHLLDRSTAGALSNIARILQRRKDHDVQSITVAYYGDEDNSGRSLVGLEVLCEDGFSTQVYLQERMLFWSSDTIVSAILMQVAYARGNEEE